jgi:hypothetical protein
LTGSNINVFRDIVSFQQETLLTPSMKFRFLRGDNIVTYRPIARHRLGKHVPRNAANNIGAVYL